MNKNALDKLVGRLGMKPELAPILESDGGYERFESAVDGILKYYETHKSPLRLITKIPRTTWIPMRTGGMRVGCYTKYYSSLNTSLEAIGSFRRYFGVGFNNKEDLTLEEIAKEKGITKQNISQRIHNIIKAFKLKHREELWYNSL